MMMWTSVMMILTLILWIIRKVIVGTVQEEVHADIRNHVTEYMKLNESRNEASFSSIS